MMRVMRPAMKKLKKDLKLKLFCIDPSIQLENALEPLQGGHLFFGHHDPHGIF